MSTSPLQEDNGLAKIHTVCAKMDAIWRPTPCHDLGIDGQIEFLEPNTARSSGYILAVQSKSGPSYFRQEDSDAVSYYPERKHREYWARLSLPVVLVLHDPERHLTIFARVKNQLPAGGPIRVRKSDLFVPSARQELLGIAQQDAKMLPPESILDEFKAVTLCRPDDKTISGIEFLLATTNILSCYFELRMCRVVALFELLAVNTGIGIGSDDYDFIQRNIMKIHSHGLTAPFLQEFEHMWYELGMVPDLAVPLSPLGMDVLGHLWSRLSSYLSVDSFSHLHMAESTGLAEVISREAQQASDRLDCSDRLGEVPR